MTNRITDCGNVKHGSCFSKSFMHPYGYASVPLSTYKTVLTEKNCEYFYKPHLAVEQFAHTIYHNANVVREFESFFKDSKGPLKMANEKMKYASAAISTKTFNSEHSMEKSVSELFSFLSSDNEFLDAELEKMNALASSIYLFTTWLGISRSIFRNLEFLNKNMQPATTATSFFAFGGMKFLREDIIKGLLRSHMSQLGSKEISQVWISTRSGKASSSRKTSSDSLGSDEPLLTSKTFGQQSTGRNYLDRYKNCRFTIILRV